MTDLSFQNISKFLCSLLRANAVNNFFKRKDFSLGFDSVNKNFIFTAKVFSENKYISPKIRKFVLEKTFPADQKAFLRICEKSSQIYLSSLIPKNQRNLLWRNHYIDFCRLAETSILELRKLAEEEYLFSYTHRDSKIGF